MNKFAVSIDTQKLSSEERNILNNLGGSFSQSHNIYSIEYNKAKEFFKRVYAIDKIKDFTPNFSIKQSIHYPDSKSSLEKINIYRTYEFKDFYTETFEEFEALIIYIKHTYVSKNAKEIVFNVGYVSYYEWEEEYIDSTLSLSFLDLETDKEYNERIKDLEINIEEQGLIKNLVELGFSIDLARNKDIQRMYYEGKFNKLDS